MKFANGLVCGIVFAMCVGQFCERNPEASTFVLSIPTQATRKASGTEFWAVRSKVTSKFGSAFYSATIRIYQTPLRATLTNYNAHLN